jgi:HAD superfamily hydrolase (TIGR01509 family)
MEEFGFYAPFKPCLLSYQLGVEKPDLQIFKILLNEIHYEANDIIFIDDRLDNVVTAQSLGIDAIHFTSCEKLKSDLMKRGISLK